MLKSVTLDAATDTVTAVFTEWISVTPSSNPLLGNIEASLFPFSNLSTKASLVSANHAINSGEARVTIALSDLGYLRGHNSSDAALLGGQGTRVGLDGVLGIDFIDATGQRGPANTTDTGNEAYVNVAPDVADPVNSPGAYGMRSSFADTIGPRLSRVPNESALPAASNTMVLGTEVNLSLRVSLTEKTADPTDSASAVSAANPANWAIKVIDLGGDGWAGNDAATDPALPGGTAAVSQVTSDTQTVLEGARYTLVIRFPATGGPTPTVGVAQITLSPAVTDLAGNVVDPATPHNVWTYNPSRVVGPNVSPGWDRN
jgi:hypothetical protein